MEMKVNPTVVINLLGGSGLGKSTTAASLFSEMKTRKFHCELVREYVKEWAWEGKPVGPFGQSIIYGKQLERESLLYGKVDYIVTDSPLLLCPIYQNFYQGHESLKETVFSDLNTAKDLGVQHINFLLRRHKEFDTRGRYETEETARKADQMVETFLNYHKIDYVDVHVPDELRVNYIIGYLEALNERTNQASTAHKGA